MINPFPKSRIYGAAICAFIMAALAVAMPIMLYTGRESITNTADTSATQNTRVADMLKIARLAKDNQQKVNDIDNAFPVATDTVAIIEVFEDAAVTGGLSIVISKAEVERNDQNQKHLSIDAEMKGSWANLYQYIYDLDKFPYRHVITRIDFSKMADKEGSGWVLNMSLSIPLMQ